MARRKRKQFWWHVAGEEGWYGAYPVIPGGIPNIGRNIVLVLVDTEEPTGSEPVVPEQDDFVIERVIGQWQLTGDASTAQNYFVHERVYVAESTSVDLAIRRLDLASEADTEFLYHAITPWAPGWSGDAWGNWQWNATSGFPTGTGLRSCDRDIRVARRVNEGQALIYHWQLEGAGIPNDESFYIKAWFRTLLRKA